MESVAMTVHAARRRTESLWGRGSQTRLDGQTDVPIAQTVGRGRLSAAAGKAGSDERVRSRRSVCAAAQRARGLFTFWVQPRGLVMSKCTCPVVPQLRSLFG